VASETVFSEVKSSGVVEYLLTREWLF